MRPGEPQGEQNTPHALPSLPPSFPWVSWLSLTLHPVALLEAHYAGGTPWCPGAAGLGQGRCLHPSEGHEAFPPLPVATSGLS